MRLLILIAFLGLLSMVHSYSYPSNMLEIMRTEFSSFVQKYHKVYPTDQEKSVRFQIFKSNYFKIYDHNAENKDWFMVVNKFTDLTEKEHKDLFHNLQINSMEADNIEYSEDILSKKYKVDWTSKCGKVENQEDCGSCYAFSAIESLQYDHYAKTGEFKYFSQQQIVDCSDKYGNDGCGGGLMDNCFKYTKAKGILTAAEYPYKARAGTCKKEGGWKNSGHVDAPKHHDNKLAAALMLRPISIAVDANSWSYYGGGRYLIYIYIYIGIIKSKSECGTQLDHGVFLVGADISGTTSYWKIKNSWGADWGEKGYIRVERNTKGGTGPCGVALMPSYAT